jgi:hypothetical protein
LVERARAVAAQKHRSLEEVILKWLAHVAAEIPVEELPDVSMIILCNLQIDEAEQAELSKLLARQREDVLSHEERGRFDMLMWNYRQRKARKAQALTVARERGLRPSSGTKS